MPNQDADATTTLAADLAPADPAPDAAEARFPAHYPWLLRVSGLYKWSFFSGFPGQAKPEAAASAQPGPGLPYWLLREEFRLDVDGRYPQMQASGTLLIGTTTRVHWIASLEKVRSYRWTGQIWYKDGNASALPHSDVEIKATPAFYASQRKATVTFTGGGAAPRTQTYRFASPYFHPVEFEFDAEEGTTAVTSIDTCAHPNRPASLTCETLNIDEVFRRAGFDVRSSGGGGVVPSEATGSNQTWSDMEMHDAMQAYWSRFNDAAQWSMWVLFAKQHDSGPNLGGVMFDDIGPNHRQGTAVFNDSFVAKPPQNDAAPDAWVERMKFWTACHEMGHAFNLAHSWQKSHPPTWGTPWIPLNNEPEARSFMNYPYNVAGGQSAFYADFEYRFSDMELLFMRHAPAAFVQMGNADWFDDHGFRQAAITPEPTFKLEVRVNRDKPVFEFLEPVMLELKLTNISGRAQLVDKHLLAESDDMTVILKRQGKPARQWAPFARYCMEAETAVVKDGESLYEPLFAAAGINGWDLAEPGVYQVQISLHMEDEDIVSNSLTLRIAPPRDWDEEYLAQDFFSEDVGRVLTFDGTRVLETAKETLHEVSAKLSDRRVALHAQVALGNPLAQDYKRLELGGRAQGMTTARDAEGKIAVDGQKTREARSLLAAALTKHPQTSAETLGHIDYRYYAERFSDWLHDEGDNAAAARVQGALHKTLSKRGVIAPVLEKIKAREASFAKKTARNGKKAA